MADSWKSMAIFVDDKGKEHLKDDKSKVTGIKILDDLKQRIEKVEKILNKVLGFVWSFEDTDDNPFLVISDESSDDRALQL
ncbi:hypothetical protein Tco_0468609 [Tanacetum coccineum]